MPSEAIVKMAKLGVVIDNLIADFQMDALAFRCWLELEQELKIAPCTLLSEINDRGIPAACWFRGDVGKVESAGSPADVGRVFGRSLTLRVPACSGGAAASVHPA